LVVPLCFLINLCLRLKKIKNKNSRLKSVFCMFETQKVSWEMLPNSYRIIAQQQQSTYCCVGGGVYQYKTGKVRQLNSLSKL
jgi:hypothetical protein